MLRHCLYCPLTLHDPIRDTEHARALAALRMVWASAAWMAVEMLASTWCVRSEEAVGGRAALAVSRTYRVLSVAPGRRVWRASVEEAKDGHERGCERAGGFGDQ